MANFEVLVYPVKLEPHPNADNIELAVIGEYRSIVQKDTLEDDDLVAYIPEGSVVPEWILKKLNLWDFEKNIGKLAGKRGNRVKSIKLRGIMSTGLILPTTHIP